MMQSMASIGTGLRIAFSLSFFELNYADNQLFSGENISFCLMTNHSLINLVTFSSPSVVFICKK